MTVEGAATLSVAALTLLFTLLRSRYEVKREEMQDMNTKIEGYKKRIEQLEEAVASCERDRIRLNTALTNATIENNALLRKMQRD